MFGPMPVEVGRLVDLEAVRVAAGALGVRSIRRHGADLEVVAEDVGRVAPFVEGAAEPEVREAGVLRLLDLHTAVWRLRRDPGADAVLALLKKALADASGDP